MPIKDEQSDPTSVDDMIITSVDEKFKIEDSDDIENWAQNDLKMTAKPKFNTFNLNEFYTPTDKLHEDDDDVRKNNKIGEPYLDQILDDFKKMDCSDGNP